MTKICKETLSDPDMLYQVFYFVCYYNGNKENIHMQ